MIEGLLNINKPSGLTSFEVVRRIKRILDYPKIGHCGTLDPMATGVLLVVFGSATKQAERFTAQEKIYLGEVQFGLSTDSGDITGKTVEEAPVPEFSREDIQSALSRFIGKIEQVPPMVSALKYGGRKLYEFAREGRTVVRLSREIEIHSLDLLEKHAQSIKIRVRCSKGTYIRVLAEDIGKALKVPAALKTLVRESSGGFHVQDSLPWDEVMTSSREMLLSKSHALGVLSAPLT